MRTLPVLALLTLVAAVFSYLGAYAVTGALAAADVIDRWPPDRDPRPRWMAATFAILLLLLVLLAAVFRWTSGRQLKRLDALGEE